MRCFWLCALAACAPMPEPADGSMSDAGRDGGMRDAGRDAGPLPITAMEAAADMGFGFNVGNTFEVDQHPREASSVNAMIDAYRGEGYRWVRIPVRWIGSDWDGEGALADAAGEIDREHPRLAQLEAIVDHALASGMYVVINSHHDEWIFEAPWSDGQRAVFVRVWTQIAELFAGRDHRLVFEIINEPHGSIVSDSAAVQALNAGAYAAIRSSGGNNAERIVIIDGEDWGSPASLRATWTDVTEIPGGGDDPYLMGSIHYYAPLALTHASDASGIDTPWSVADIEASFDAVLAWASGRLPIFVGELGVNWDQHAHTINDNVRSWYAAVASEARERGWVFALWDDGGWYRVMNRSDQTFNGLEDAALPD